MNNIIDDRDPSILYSKGWSQGGRSGNVNLTTTITQTSGENATFIFHGVKVAVYGTILSTNLTSPLSSYQLDGKTTTFEPEWAPETRRSYSFFQSPPLLDGTHTLVVTNLGNNSEKFILDYFTVSVPPSTSSTSTTPKSTSESSSSSVSFTTTRSISSPTATTSSVILFPVVFTSTSTTSLRTVSPSPTATSLGGSVPDHRSIPIATLAISISAAAAGTILVIGIIYFFLRRRRRRLGSNANIISTFWGDKQQVPDLPVNQRSPSARSAHEDPPQYESPHPLAI